MIRPVCLVATVVMWSAAPLSSMAQDLAPASAPHAVPAKRSAHKIKTSRTVKPAQDGAKPLEPWAAVDPGRATGAPVPAEPGAAAVPGIRHIVQPDQDALSYGVQWSSSNAPNAGQYSTQGVINEVNHDLGAPNAVGTDAEVGLKMHF